MGCQCSDSKQRPTCCLSLQEQKHVLLQQVQNELDSGRLDIALATVERFLKLDQNDSQALYYQGLCYMKKNQFSKVIEIADKGLKHTTEVINFNQLKADVYFEQKNYKECAKLYKQILQKLEDDANANYNYGICQFELQQFEECVKYFEKISRINENYLKTQKYLGIAYYRLKDLDQTVIHLEKSLHTEPHNEEVLLLLSEVWNEKKDFQKSYTYSFKLCSINPSICSAQVIQAESLFQLKNYDAALTIYDLLIKTYPNVEENWIKKAKIHFFLHDTMACNSAIDQYLSKNQKNPEAFNLKGVCLHEQSFIQQALVFYTKAYQINKTEVKYIYNLALAQFQLKYFEEALENFNRIQSLKANFLDVKDRIEVAQIEYNNYAFYYECMPKKQFTFNLTTQTNPECEICLIELHDGNQIRQTNCCMKIVHSECIDEWIIQRNNKICPQCNTEWVMLFLNTEEKIPARVEASQERQQPSHIINLQFSQILNWVQLPPQHQQME